jgi:type I restriction enzyme S subunit
MVNPLVKRIMASIHVSRTLAGLRDTLLPKLISGEVWVGDAARFVARHDGLDGGGRVNHGRA